MEQDASRIAARDGAGSHSTWADIRPRTKNDIRKHRSIRKGHIPKMPV